jgi:hypothetical protein
MTDITSDQARTAEAIVTQGLSEMLANVTTSLDPDNSIVIAYAINTYLETIGRMGGRNKLTAQDVTRLFTIINLYLEGGTVKLQTREDFAPKGRPTR